MNLSLPILSAVFMATQFQLLGNGQTYTKVGLGAIQASNYVTILLRLTEHYVVDGDKVDELRKIFARNLKPEWWVLANTSGQASLPRLSVTFSHKDGDTTALIVRIPIDETTLKSEDKGTAKIEEELDAFVTTHKLSRSVGGTAPGDHVHTQEMK